MVDHLLRSGRVVQYRGLGYSNRFDTLQRLHTLPTLWSTDLMIPFGWTSIAPTKLSWPVTLSSYHREPLSYGVLPWVALCPQNTCHHRGQTKLSQPGMGPTQLNWAHRVITAYVIRVARVHNPPSLEVPVRAITRTTQVTIIPYRQMWLHG